MKKLSILYIFILMSLAAWSQLPREYLETAAENNPELKARFSEYQAELEKVPQVSSLPDPTLAFGYFISPVETRVGAQQARFSVNQMFPWIGVLENNKLASVKSAEAAYYRFIESRNRIFFELKQSWNELYTIRKKIEIKQESLDWLQKMESTTRQQFQTGKAKLSDVLTIQMEIRELKDQIKRLSDKEEAQLTAFNLLINRSEDSPVETPSQLIPVAGPEKIYQPDSLSSNPKLLSLTKQEKSLEYASEAAKKQNYPNIGVGLDYIIVNERTDMNVSDNGKDAILPKLSVSIPLFGKKNRARVREVVKRQEALKHKQEDLKNKLTTKLKDAWYEYKDALNRIELNRDQISSAEKALEVLYSSYSNNGNDFDEVIEMERRLIDYRFQLHQAIAGHNTALARISYLTDQNNMNHETE